MKTNLVLFVLLLISSSISDRKKIENKISQGPDALIGRWELVKEYQSGQQLFDLTEKSKLVADSISLRRKSNVRITQSDSLEVIKNIDERLESAKNSFLDFKENGEVSVGALSENSNGVLQHFVDEGIYEIDDERIRIEARHEDIPIYLTGSFRWKIQKNMLYLEIINQPKGSYRVFRRSE